MHSTVRFFTTQIFENFVYYGTIPCSDCCILHKLCLKIQSAPLSSYLLVERTSDSSEAIKVAVIQALVLPMPRTEHKATSSQERLLTYFNKECGDSAI